MSEDGFDEANIQATQAQLAELKAEGQIGFAGGAGAGGGSGGDNNEGGPDGEGSVGRRGGVAWGGAVRACRVLCDVRGGVA
jgi:hypothetical protein